MRETQVSLIGACGLNPHSALPNRSCSFPGSYI
jgi:hypothetical protein